MKNPWCSLHPAVPVEPGKPERVDYEYEGNICNLGNGVKRVGVSYRKAKKA
jgi:hypothetical protein